MENKKLKIIEEKLKNILNLIGEEAEFKIEEKEGEIFVNLQPENPGILIGYHGKTLSALQLILSLMVYRQLKEWVKVIVNVGDYRQRREEILKRMALSAAQKVKSFRQPQELPPMSSAERRIIHLTLANDPEVQTESLGEGKERRVVVKPK